MNNLVSAQKMLGAPITFIGLPRWLSGNESACQCRRCVFDPWVGKIPWRRTWLPTPVFLPGKVRGQRSLAGYRPWGHKELDTTKLSHARVSTYIIFICIPSRREIVEAMLGDL